jgi:chromosome segregation protein
MIIKKLELQGFKTFPERTKIVFHTGITAIIGPNGTGKSNIVESIQWILGGHRVRSVRGEKIDDAIFTGNTKRPALGMADATLFLQNAEEELQINHRAFRTGESEYRLNGKVVRLKDIQDELWKKSISENKYFVIEQGAIGTFVTSKPTEKRALVEEAAGTAYYKDKKRQAENKLEDSEQNLVRLEDILAEVAKAKNSLQRQAGAAERYRKLRERIRELTAIHFRHKNEQFLHAQHEVQTHYDDSLARERERLARLTAEEKAVNEKRAEAWNLEQSLKEGRENLYTFRSQIARLEAEQERESKRIEFLEESRRKAAADADELLAELLHLEHDFLKNREDLELQTQAIAQKRRETDEAELALQETRAKIGPWAKKVEDFRNEYLQKFAELTEARNEGAKIEKELELIRRQEQKLLVQQKDSQTQLGLKEKEFDGLRNGRSETRRKIAEKEEGISDLKRILGEFSKTIENLQAKIRELKDKRDEDAYHLQALKKLEEKERAGEPSQDVEGALGFFTDLIESDPADAPLIDVFWKEEAKATVIPAEEILKNLTGREIKGCFLLVAPLKKEQAPPTVIQDPDVVGMLKSRLRPSAPIQDRMPDLLDAVIVNGIRSAINLWLQFPAFNYISLNGDLLLSTGLLRLGQRKEGVFTLSQEIKELEKKIARRDADIAPVAGQHEANVREKQKLEIGIQSETVLIAGLHQKLQDMERNLALLQAEKEKYKNDQAIFGHELEVLAMDKRVFAEKLEFQSKIIRDLEEQETALKNRAEAEEKEFGLHREKTNQEANNILELRGAADVLQEKIRNLQALVKNLGVRKESTTAKIKSLQEEVRNSEEEAARLNSLVIELGEKVKKQEQEKTEQGVLLAQNEVRLDELQQGLAGAEDALKKIREEYEGQKDERMKWEIRKAENDRDLVNLEETCWQELKKTLQELKAETPPAQAPEGDVETELEEAKEKLLKYGSVNLMAEEEYLAQKERYDFLLKQKADLKESIAQTREAILKIDEESRQRFLTALAEINKNFQDLFAMLFKGGTAELKLLDEADPLESGVDVVAQPPGKKVQNMGLLSGGEKSLTSLAFLFALFRYKPTPFCILDEVDAALDDVNLARFLDLMKQIKSETQFIIITHNYKTMEVADYIYGTTMEVPNVTKIFSMKFEKKGDAEKVD